MDCSSLICRCCLKRTEDTNWSSPKGEHLGLPTYVQSQIRTLKLTIISGVWRVERISSFGYGTRAMLSGLNRIENDTLWICFKQFFLDTGKEIARSTRRSQQLPGGNRLTMHGQIIFNYRFRQQMSVCPGEMYQDFEPENEMDWTLVLEASCSKKDAIACANPAMWYRNKAQ